MGDVLKAVSRHPGLDPGSRFFFLSRRIEEAGPRLKAGATKVS
jgi:hypothetical protein